MTRAQRLAWWALPSLLCLWIYWYGLKAWFLQDDFAWLGLRLSIFNFHDLLEALFAPKAQGTIRPLSERAYFLILEKLFGYDALPFRIVAFATAFADLALLSVITTRITGLRWSGPLAAIFWIVNSSLATAMSWSSTYNQLLCILFLLSGIYCLQRFIETGKRRYYLLQWLAFLAGFGALELNVVYPALALLYVLCFARKFVASTLALFPASVAFTLIHNHYAPTVKSGVYGMYWDAHIVQTFWKYVVWALGPQRIALIGWSFPRLVSIGTGLLLAGLLAFAGWKLCRKNWAPAFMIGWFLIVLAPVLPLREHISHYYLAIPVAGLAMLAGWACAEAALGSWRARGIAAALASIYLISSIPVDRTIVRWQHDRSIEARDLFFGVERAHELHPHDVILLKGVNDGLFWGVISDSPFRLLGVNEIYLTPDTAANITRHPEIRSIDDFVLPDAVVLKALDGNRAVVYDAGSFPIRNVTSTYTRLAGSLLSRELPRQVDVGQILYNDQLGPTWYAAEDGFRWMPASATVKLGRPQNSGDRLYLSGVLPEQLVENNPLHLSVSVDGQAVQTFTLDRRNTSFEVWAELPRRDYSPDGVMITLTADRTYTPPSDPRPLSVAFGKIGIR